MAKSGVKFKDTMAAYDRLRGEIAGRKFAPVYLLMGEEAFFIMEYDDDLGKSISIENFYENIRQGAMPTTSQVNPEQYEAMFEPILKEGKDIIHMTLSSGISASTASNAA